MSHLLVTGGSRGIGAAVVRLAVSRGEVVTFTMRTGGSDGVALVGELGDRVRALRADVADAGGADAVLENAVAGLGPVDVLVNNAGTTGRLGPFVDRSDDDVRRVFDVNVLGLVALSRAAVRRWVAEGRGGTIVNISSIAAQTGAPGEYVEYAASKAAVDALTRGLGRELAAYGVRVVGVAPGTTLTGIHAAAGDPERAHRVGRAVPLRRAADPEEIAEVVLFAASERASYVTGTTITVAGGS